MVERGKGGAIVNVSSVASKLALADHAVYAASKAGLDQLTKVMALELGPHQVGTVVHSGGTLLVKWTLIVSM